MDQNCNLSAYFNTQGAIRKLIEELSHFDSQPPNISIEDDEMLSLIASEAVKGIDIARRYPAFYRKLLNNANLRRTFLDLLQMLEQANTPAIAGADKRMGSDLSFLNRPTPRPVFEMSGQDSWRVVWRRTLQQLQEIFSPSELAYRADPDLLEDAWFTLVREEVEIEKSLCTVALECTLSGDMDNALATYLNFAITLGHQIPAAQLPIRANLAWGQYNQTVLVSTEGRVKFPDIPFALIYDDQSQKIKCDLNLVLEFSR